MTQASTPNETRRYGWISALLGMASGLAYLILVLIHARGIWYAVVAIVIAMLFVSLTLYRRSRSGQDVTRPNR